MQGIYRIDGPGNKIYIGSAVNFKDRWNKHLRELRKNEHHAQKLQRAYNKYGEDAFIFSVVEMVEDKDDLLRIEQIWLDILFSSLAPAEIYNGLSRVTIAGAHTGHKHTEETKQLIAQNRKGKPGCKHTDEYKAKMSTLKKGKAPIWSYPSQLKTYYFQSPDGQLYKIIGLNNFARMFSLNASMLSKVYQGERSHHKGWRKASIDESRLSEYTFVVLESKYNTGTEAITS